jgi:hypothetical protein
MNSITQTTEPTKLLQSPEIGTLTEALVHFHSKCPKIPKDRKGTYGKYADLSTILEKVQPVLNECGLAVIQIPSGEFGLITILSHTSGEYIGAKYEMQPEERIIDKATKEKAITPQSIGSVITYQRRYALGAILSLNIDDDTDGEGPKEPEPPKKSAKELLAEKSAAASASATSAVTAASKPTTADVKAETKQESSETKLASGETTTKLMNEGGGPTSESLNNPCGDALAAKIKEALSQLEQKTKGVTADFVGRFKASRGKTATFAKDLTIAEAHAALKAIEEKNIIAFFDKQLQTSA